jgi:hypothetical protein
VAVACSGLVSSAGAAAPSGQLALDSATGPLTRTDTPMPFAQLESRADELSKEYRGQLELLTDAKNAAQTASAQAKLLNRELADAHNEVARLAEESYTGDALDPALSVLSGGDPGQVLGRASILEYLARQRDAREQQLQQLTVASQQAAQAAQGKVAGLSQLVAQLTSQQQRIKHLLAQYKPQSPTIGNSITPRMSKVRDEVDRRFGPFAAIGCYRPGNDGEHPLGRACDFMLDTGGVMPAASSVQLGYDIAAWAQANASRLGIMYVIYRQRIWDVRMPSSGWRPMEDRGSITANHFDHVHISVF